MISSETAEHYTWGQRCDGWHLVRAEGLSVIQERMPPGTSEVRHFHQTARQFFFVLSGTLTIEAAGHRETLRTHQGFEVLPGVPHQVFNESGDLVEFLVISQPPSHGDRIPAPR
jgi:mannose-6-phosphate isomerase-like protein (cupin superfamily)